MTDDWKDDEAEATADPLLSGFVNFIERRPPGAGLAITLWVPGGVVSGRLVSSNHWHTQVGAILAPDLKDEVAETSRGRYADLKEEEQHDEEAVRGREFLFIHLMNARLVSPSGLVPSGDGVLWRGRLEQVAGFSLGQFGTPGAPTQ